MVQIAGADRYMTLDPHAYQIQGFFSIPGDVLNASHILGEYVLENLRPYLRDPVVVTVDLGYAKKGRDFAARIDAPIAFVEKRRVANDARAEALTIIGDVKGRDVVLVDDEIDTGRSIAQAVNLIKENGAQRIYVTFVHPIFSGDAVQRLSSLPVTEYITTDSIPIVVEKREAFGNRLTILTVATLLGEVIRRAHEGRSVGQMFNE
jgi:ribose-phosphate pyrophosphokinase